MPPTYEYSCEPCNNNYEVIKTMSSYDGKDPCPSCGEIGCRIFSSNVHFIGQSVQNAEYNPGLGCVVKNKYHRAELCKAKNLEEIGNESPVKIKEKYKKERQERIDKRHYSDSDLGHLAEQLRPRR